MLVALIGPGLVGQEFLRQLRQYQQLVAAARFPDFSLVAISNSKAMLLAASPTQPLSIDPSLLLQQLNTGGTITANQKLQEQDANGDLINPSIQTTFTCRPVDLSSLIEYVAGMSTASSTPALVVDCTSSDRVAKQYPSWLHRGLHIVTPNKKAFSGELGLWREIVKATTKKPGVPYPICYHESTVGAGLPIISTLKDLLLTGDKIVRIEGVFSGTLSYLFNEFSSATTAANGAAEERRKFSDIVKDAKNKGYTEPDPRDDLNGMDVARKVVILARVAGIDLQLETLPVENIVPPELRAVETAEDFMDRLPDFDGYFDKLNKKAHAKQEVLRYVGVVSDSPGTTGRSCEVRLRSFPVSHPFAQLKGSDNVVAFYTQRFSSSPLIVQGAGAGAAVTAHGILSDVIKISEISGYNR